MLTPEQLGFFARNGFLHLEAVASPAVCEALVERTWTRLPKDWSRDDRSTWKGMAQDSCHIADVRVRRGHFQFQKGDLIGDPTIASAFSERAAGGDVARQLIGHPLSKMRLRGLYCIVPLADEIRFKSMARPHIESHPAQLILLCYLRDVAPGGGGLHVWPGSHREIYPAMGSRLEHVGTPEYDAIFARWASLTPHEVPGRQGDVVIIHHRLLHAPSLNRLDRIRYAFLCDYQREDFRNLCTLRPSSDVWEDWPAIAALPPALRDAPPDIALAPQTGLVETTTLDAEHVRLSVAHTKNTDPSNVRKADASALARSRRADDIWLLLSDNPATANDWEIYPRGADLSATGLRIWVDGNPVDSVCRYDHIARLPLGPGQHRVRIDGLDRRAWLRVLKVRLPFVETEFLLKAELATGPAEFEFHAP